MTPKIWLLIGLYHIQDAVTFSAYSQSAEGGISGSSPLPEPTGLANLLQLKVGMKAKFGDNAVVQRGTQISGKKVWAALWQRVDAKFMSVKKWENHMGGRQLKLLDIYSWQTVRAGEGEQAVAEVALAEDEGEQVVQDSTLDLGKDYWEDFDKEVAYIEDEWNDNT
jgi:hypothetical protein